MKRLCNGGQQIYALFRDIRINEHRQYSRYAQIRTSVLTLFHSGCSRESLCVLPEVPSVCSIAACYRCCHIAGHTQVHCIQTQQYGMMID